MKINFRSSFEQGLLGIIDTALPIFFVNLIGGDFLSAFFAAFYQFILTFIMIFVNTSIFQFFYYKKMKWLSIIVPTTLTTFFSFVLHSYANSPQPFLSALTIFLMALWYYLILKYLLNKYQTISVVKLAKKFKNYFIKDVLKIRRWEFWNPKYFNIPFYIYLFTKSSFNGLRPQTLLKANYILDHGDLRAKKTDIYNIFDKKYFPKTLNLNSNKSEDELLSNALKFAKKVNYPLIGKPNIGEIGLGAKLIRNEKKLIKLISVISSFENLEFLLQEYINSPIEFGVFYHKLNGKSNIVGINGKDFPTIIGDGEKSIIELAKSKEHYSNHWRGFMNDFDINKIPKKGEIIRLSYIGSHTMGCVFTDKTYLLTKKIELKFSKIFDKVDGFNIGRIDIRTNSIKDFQEGKFKLIEVNGISSLPTEMFDPKYSLIQGYSIFLKFGDRLIKSAKEHKYKEMKILPKKELFKKLKEDRIKMEELHKKLIEF